MRIRTLSAGLVALALVASSCSENEVFAPTQKLARSSKISAGAPQLPAVRISEFHYDNAGTDSSEKVEISAPAGTDLTNWKLVLYNGAASSRAPYTTTALSGVVPATCGARGVVVISYPSNGIQNGDPDGMALVRPNGNVVEFLSYGGTFVAASGAAVGVLSTDVGVKESAEAPTDNHVVSSLQLGVDGIWFNSNKNADPTTRDNTFGTCNDNFPPSPAPGPVATVAVSPLAASVVTGASQLFGAAAFDADNDPVIDAEISWSVSNGNAIVNGNGFVTAVSPGDAQITATVNGVSGSATVHVTLPAPLPPIRFSEIHYDPVGTDAGEAIEIEGPAGSSLDGWQIVLYNGHDSAAYSTVALAGTIPPTCGGRGVVVTNYESNGVQNGSPDGFALVDGTGSVVEFLSYEGSFKAKDGPASGMESTDIGVSETSVPANQSLQRVTSGVWKGPFVSSFGACNGDGGAAAGKSLTFSGRLPTDPALPVGFEDQLFATLHDGASTVPTTITWESATPDVASIDANGVMHAIAAGTATFVATAADGTAATYSLPTTVATLGGTADYTGNAEFGVPTDADASDDFIITRDQYTISYNRNRNTPNWVSYEFDATHFGTNVDRCDCFTHDPALPSDFTPLTTADYTGAGAFAGYGIDRGHMARSFDFTSGTLDNARSYYLSNIIPQAAAVNQGPWKLLEDSLGNLARFHDKEVYVIDGVAGSLGTVKGEGKITIPASEWKVALVLPRNHRLADVHRWSDIDDVIAVNMPNEPSIEATWETYKTTVDEIERISGYDLLALLPDNIEESVETRDYSEARSLDAARGLILDLASVANLPRGNATSLQAKIDAAQQQLGIAEPVPAANQLRAALNELEALTDSHRITPDQGATLRALINAVLSSISS